MAYELAAIEGLDALLHPSSDAANLDLQQQAQAGAYRAFELRHERTPSLAHQIPGRRYVFFSAISY